MASAALLLSLCSAVPAWAASISGELESVTDTAINGQVSWETSSAEPVSIEITVAREDEPEVFHTITVNGISEGEDGAPVSFSCEIDWNEFVESRYLVTAKMRRTDEGLAANLAELRKTRQNIKASQRTGQN